MFNIYNLPRGINRDEIFETLIKKPGLKIERIISAGQVSAEGFWYDQNQHEWVLLLQGEARLGWEDGRRQELKAGDCLLIMANEKHRIEYTSQDPPCIWLAVHFA